MNLQSWSEMTFWSCFKDHVTEDGGRKELSPLTTCGTRHHSLWDWRNTVDSEFPSIIAPFLFCLSANDLDTAEAGEIFSSLLKAHLEWCGAIKGKTPPENPQSSHTIRRTRKIVKVTEDIRRLKNNSRSTLKRTPSAFHNLVRLHNKTRKAKDNLEASQSLKRHERAFRNNPWHYAKSACKMLNLQTELTCTCTEAHDYFASMVTDNSNYSSLSSWIEQSTNRADVYLHWSPWLLCIYGHWQQQLLITFIMDWAGDASP